MHMAQVQLMLPPFHFWFVLYTSAAWTLLTQREPFHKILSEIELHRLGCMGC